MQQQSKPRRFANDSGKNFFWASFTLTFSLGLVFLFIALPQAHAVDVDVTSLVGAPCVPSGVLSSCGIWDESLCASAGTRTRSCTDSCGDSATDNGICGGGVSCGVYSCSFTACVNGFQNQICGDSCGSTTVEVACGSTCGDGIIGTGEQCDDFSACCVSCSTALVIQNISSPVTGSAATVKWTTNGWTGGACAQSGTASVLDTTSLLEWGQNGNYNEGSASLSGNPYSHPITGLVLDTLYTFRITATDGVLTDVEAGSFSTFPPEICTNGIDDDGDGLIDIADSDCPCTAIWDCNVDDVNDAECIDGQQLKICTQNPLDECWDISTNPSETLQCDGPCEGVICVPPEVINEETCGCEPELGYCGNGICEPSLDEDPESCQVDCPGCFSVWDCTPWEPSACPTEGPQEGFQTRGCVDISTPPCLPPTSQEDVSRTCSGVCDPEVTCGAGETINDELCRCDAVVPWCGNSICESDETFKDCPVDCVEICIPNWLPSAWGPCINDTQHRTVTDISVPSCDLDIDKPPTSRSCVCEPEVACGDHQTIDNVNCRCNDKVPWCGNRICEENEFTWSCPVDCGLPPEFRLTLTACLDGLDNDKDGFVDYPADPGCSSPSDNSELSLAEILENIQDFLKNILDNEAVEAVNKLAAPAVVVAIAINTFASFSFFNLLSYLRYFFSQPFAALFRRKRKKWGVIYNALTKRPVDLAIVRLYDNQTKRIVQSRVTDRQGRYTFLAQPGRYYITVTKPKFDFPSNYLKDEKEDVKYLDIYHGEVIEVTEKNAAITANIPIDSQVEEKPVGKVIFQHYLRKVQYFAAFSAIPLAVFSVAISPSPLTFTLLGFHALLFVLFRRLGYQKKPKSWGIIYDKTNKKPLGRAIARIYDKKYNKLLETRVTDAKGRYSFLVNNNIYVVTAEKLGYKQFKTEDIDLVKKDVDTVVGMDIGLNKAKPGEIPETLAPAPPTPPPAGAPPSAPTAPPVGKVGLPVSTPLPAPSTTPPEPKSLAPDDVTESLDQAKPAPPQPTPDTKPSITEDSIEEKIDELSVTRDSLEDLVKQKEEVAEVKEEIDAKQAELEKLEDKAEKIEKRVEEKIKEEKTEERSAEDKPERPVTKKPPKDVPPGTPDKSIFG